jgi:hypothetical protein
LLLERRHRWLAGRGECGCAGFRQWRGAFLSAAEQQRAGAKRNSEACFSSATGAVFGVANRNLHAAKSYGARRGASIELKQLSTGTRRTKILSPNRKNGLTAVENGTHNYAVD